MYHKYHFISLYTIKYHYKNLSFSQIDSEEFATRHSEKFNVQFINRQYQTVDTAKQQQTVSASKKNVSFIESSSEEANDAKNKSILKQESNPLFKPSDNNVKPENSDASVVVSANAPKNKKTEGYEILVSFSQINST